MSVSSLESELSCLCWSDGILSSSLDSESSPCGSSGGISLYLVVVEDDGFYHRGDDGIILCGGLNSSLLVVGLVGIVEIGRDIIVMNR